MTKQLVSLVPGLFGFTSVGAVSYFEDVERSLGLALRKLGVEARIVRCMTEPTASTPRRASSLCRQVVRKGGLGARELHFVGHSTGGLDVRMLLTPGVKIASGDSGERARDNRQRRRYYRSDALGPAIGDRDPLWTRVWCAA